MSHDVDAITAKLRGKFIVFDGPDGCGKSLQRNRVADALSGAGSDVVSCRDPGGTEIGDRIRSVLLDYDLSLMDVRCEAMLFMASRAQLVREIIEPALADGRTVLCDRFVSSTCAYQGAAGFDPRRVIDLARFAIGDCWPHATILLDVDVETGFARIGRKPHHAGKNRRRSAGEGSLFNNAAPDAMEARSIEFHRKVRELYLSLHEYYPTPVVTIDARSDENSVFDQVCEALQRAPL